MARVFQLQECSLEDWEDAFTVFGDRDDHIGNSGLDTLHWYRVFLELIGKAAAGKRS